MRRVVIIASTLALLAPAVAGAHPSYRWACASGGSATSDGAYVTGAPYRVSMSGKTQRAIWEHVPTGEFNTPHNGDRVAQIPCLVAETVASHGISAWAASPDGNAVDLPDEKVVGYSPGPLIGRFHCDGVTNGYTDNTYETCTHPTGRFGYISVKFTIEPNPNGS